MNKTIILLAALLSAGTFSANTIPLHNEPVIKQKANLEDDIAMVDASGKVVSLSDLKGKVVFINLWATWCRPCVEEMPTISSLKDQFEGNDNIVFALLNVEADLEKSKKFMKDRQLDLPIYVLGKDLPPKYFQGAIPTTLIFDKSGALVSLSQGARDFSQPEVFSALNELTKK